MKTHVLWIVWIIFLEIAYPLPVGGNLSGEPEGASSRSAPALRLEMTTPFLRVGQEQIVTVWIENAPLVYGAQAEVAFDADRVEVVDADPDQAGVQISPGDFFDPQQTVTVRNLVDDLPDTIDYAVALVHPAPEVGGQGILLTLKLRAKHAGTTRLTLSGALGTTSGATIDLSPVTTEIEVLKYSRIYLPILWRSSR